MTLIVEATVPIVIRLPNIKIIKTIFTMESSEMFNEDLLFGSDRGGKQDC